MNSHYEQAIGYADLNGTKVYQVKNYAGKEMISPNKQGLRMRSECD
jgi:hypothetical protein